MIRFAHDMSDAEYRAADGLSVHRLGDFAKSPAHYQYPKPREVSPAMMIGSATHTATLEPGDFGDRYMLADCKIRSGKVWDAANALAESRGAECLTVGEHDLVMKMRDSVWMHPAARNLIDSQTQVEVPMFWEKFDRQCKGKPDLTIASLDGFPVIVDLKTAEDANPERWKFICEKYRYHVQAAYYCDGYAAITGNMPFFIHIVVEKSYPYAVAVILLPNNWIELGRQTYEDDLKRLSVCEQSDNWSAYGDGIVTLDMNPWTEKKLKLKGV